MKREYKDVGDDDDFGNEETNKVIADTKKEVVSLGENIKKHAEEIAKKFEDLKEELEKKTDALTTEKIKKLTDDLTTRQQKYDQLVDNIKEYEKRMDDLEVAFQRPGGEGEKIDSKYAEAVEYGKSKLAVSGQKVTFEALERIEKEADVEAYKKATKAFKKYLQRGANALDPDAHKTIFVGSDPAGGILVPPTISNRIIEFLREMDPIRGLASVETISTDHLQMMVDADEAEAVWEDTETNIVEETQTPKPEEILSIYAYNLSARPKITQQMIEDSVRDMEGWLARKVGNRFARSEASKFVNGDGIKQPKGFLRYPTGTAWNQVEQINMGHASELTADGFIRVKYAMIEYFLNRGTWLMNRDTYAKTMQLKNGQGDYIWKPGLLMADIQATIEGSPVRMSPTMPTVAANALAIAYADWMEAYTIVDRLGITTLRDPYSKQPFIQFWTRKRVGGAVTNGQAIKIGKIAA